MASFTALSNIRRATFGSIPLHQSKTRQQGISSHPSQRGHTLSPVDVESFGTCPINNRGMAHFSTSNGFSASKPVLLNKTSKISHTKKVSAPSHSTLKPLKYGREDTSSENKTQEEPSSQKRRVPRLLAFGGLTALFLAAFVVAAQYAAYQQDERYALKCFGPTATLVEEVLESIRVGNANGNPNGFIPCLPTRSDLYNLLFEMNGHVNLQFLFHAYMLDKRSEYYSNNIFGRYEANRMSVRMELMNQYMNLVISAALKLGYLTSQDAENFSKTGIWSLPCIYHIPKSNTSPLSLDANWYKKIW